MRRTGKRAEKKNRKLSNQKRDKSGRKKAKVERKKEEGKHEKCGPESLKEGDERNRKRASRGSQMQGETAEGKRRLHLKLLAFSCVS